MRLNFRRIGIFLLILALSVGFGFGFDAVATAIEKKQSPMPASLTEDVQKNAKEFGIPEHILWGFIKAQSDFSSNKVDSDGSIGLMQLTAEEYTMIAETVLKEPVGDAALLYAPQPNLRFGSAYLSYLFHRYGIWETAFAAYEVGTDTVDGWLLDKSLLGTDQNLATIPDARAKALAKDALRAAENYKRLYFENS